MAITFIYKIGTTGNASLNYDMQNKTASIKNDSADSLNYVLRDKREQDFELSKEYLDMMKPWVVKNEDGSITFKTIKSFQRCTDGNTYDQWERVRKDRRENHSERSNQALQYCIVQNFGEAIDPTIANEIGLKFAQRYLPNYQVVISTHINTGHVHNHIEFNATDVDGNKYHDCRQSIADIRKVSDELCEEYGLDVLEDTREFNYVTYRDENGKQKIYEHTERKDNHLLGEAYNKNSYINTSLYASGFKNSEAHAVILKKDFDRFVPYAVSYEDLLSLMRQVGYEISDKTQKGEWKAHISFKLGDWQKAVRDSALGEDYERINLTEKIESYNIGMKELYEFREELEIGNSFVSDEKEPSTVDTVSYNSEEKESNYSYGKVNVDTIDEEYFYRRKKREEEQIEARRRSEIEKAIIHDVKTTNRELSVALGGAMRSRATTNSAVIHSQNNKTNRMIERINSGLKTLKFVENNNIHSITQMNDIVRSMSEKRSEIYVEAKHIKELLARGNKELERIKRYNELKESVNNKSSNEEYDLTERENEVALLKTYEKSLKEHKLLLPEQQKIFSDNMTRWTAQYNALLKNLESLSLRISEYDDTLYNISMIDRRNGNLHGEEIEQYREMRQEFRKDREKEKKETVIE